MRVRMTLKKEKREVYKITGRKLDPEIPGDMALKAFETSTKFAMSYLFALFTSGLGGYFAAKVFFGFDYAAVRPKLTQSLFIAAVLMFLTIMVEVGLYVTKTLKSDLITQKAQRFKKANEQRKFDEYYYRTKGQAGQENASADPRVGTAHVGTEGRSEPSAEFEAKERLQKTGPREETLTQESSTKKDK